MTHHADLEAIDRHIGRTMGRVKTVFHEIVSDDLHIDVHYVKTSLFRRFELLVTSGMSAVPMNVPENCEECRFAEVMVLLPKGWPLTTDAFQDEKNYWPVRLLKDIARFPYYQKTWLGFGHTVAHSESGSVDDLAPYASNTQLCASVILPSFSLDESAWRLKRKGAGEIFFWSIVPLHRAELKFKMERGIDALLELFDKHGVTDRIDPHRPSVV